jgi:hypothetical protein
MPVGAADFLLLRRKARWWLYWIPIQLPILVIAGLMSLIGAYAWTLYLPNPLFRPVEVILPSCLTWLFLSPFLASASAKRALKIGILSPLVGSVFVIWLRIGPVADVDWEGMSGFLSLVVYALSYILVTSWITLPVGIATSLVIRWVLRRWPPAG